MGALEAAPLNSYDSGLVGMQNPMTKLLRDVLRRAEATALVLLVVQAVMGAQTSGSPRVWVAIVLGVAVLGSALDLLFGRQAPPA